MLRFRLEPHDEVISTNDLALARARTGAPEGLVVLARSQRGGRGRLGRRWHSPPGNLYASLLLRPERPLAACTRLALVAGLALQRTLEALAPALAPKLRLKWPNDLLLNGAKLAGVLVEAAGSTGRDGIIIGMGVNLTSHPHLEDRPTTHLAAHGVELEPTALVEALEPEFARLYRRWLDEGFPALAHLYRAALTGLGQPVVVQRPQGRLSGMLEDVDVEGAALVRCGPRRVRVLAGELELLWWEGGHHAAGT